MTSTWSSPAARATSSPRDAYLVAQADAHTDFDVSPDTLPLPDESALTPTMLIQQSSQPLPFAHTQAHAQAQLYPRERDSLKSTFTLNPIIRLPPLSTSTSTSTSSASSPSSARSSFAFSRSQPATSPSPLIPTYSPLQSYTSPNSPRTHSPSAPRTPHHKQPNKRFSETYTSTLTSTSTSTSTSTPTPTSSPTSSPAASEMLTRKLQSPKRRSMPVNTHARPQRLIAAPPPLTVHCSNSPASTPVSPMDLTCGSPGSHSLRARVALGSMRRHSRNNSMCGSIDGVSVCVYTGEQEGKGEFVAKHMLYYDVLNQVLLVCEGAQRERVTHSIGIDTLTYICIKTTAASASTSPPISPHTATSVSTSSSTSPSTSTHAYLDRVFSIRYAENELLYIECDSVQQCSQLLVQLDQLLLNAGYSTHQVNGCESASVKFVVKCVPKRAYSETDKYAHTQQLSPRVLSSRLSLSDNTQPVTTHIHPHIVCIHIICSLLYVDVQRASIESAVLSPASLSFFALSCTPSPIPSSPPPANSSPRSKRILQNASPRRHVAASPSSSPLVHTNTPTHTHADADAGADADAHTHAQVDENENEDEVHTRSPSASTSCSIISAIHNLSLRPTSTGAHDTLASTTLPSPSSSDSLTHSSTRTSSIATTTAASTSLLTLTRRLKNGTPLILHPSTTSSTSASTSASTSTIDILCMYVPREEHRKAGVYGGLSWVDRCHWTKRMDWFVPLCEETCVYVQATPFMVTVRNSGSEASLGVSAASANVLQAWLNDVLALLQSKGWKGSAQTQVTS